MMNLKEITSLKNTKIKWLKKLSQKKHRRQNNQFIVENLTIIYDALKSGYDFQDLFVTKDFVDRHQEKFEYLQEKSKVPEYYLIDEELNKYYSQLDTPSGITAVYEPKPSSLDQAKSVVYLNGIKDPGNMGTIMRSALAFGVSNVVLDATCVDIYNPKVINAAKDAIFKLNIIEDSLGVWLKKNKGVLPIYVANSSDGISLSEVKSGKRFCLVLGSESHGVSEEIVQLADKNIRIEITGDIESLNVSSAAAILLYGLK
ncbi:MAG: RNA methyltransferase [Candidatus Omnitrophica bacterium]|nr:RNA methyltransferase [Candidatus Omnitrophota bacterium]